MPTERRYELHLRFEARRDLSEVTFLDTAALEPFVQATRTRRTTGVPICLHPRSAAVQRLISLRGLGERSVLKPAGWDTSRAVSTAREPAPQAGHRLA